MIRDSTPSLADQAQRHFVLALVDLATQAGGVRLAVLRRQQVAAVDLFSGKKVWDVPLGSWIPGMNTGTVTLGGPMVTAGGLVFTAAAMDNYLRAFDSDSGKELWKYELPASGQATPMTFEMNGRQYLVIMAGGHHFMGTPVSDQLVAYALPSN